MSEPTFFDAVGGHAPLRSSGDRVLCRCGDDAPLRALYPEADLGPAAERLRMFLEQYWGGLTTYSEQRGHPRLRMRHHPYAVTPPSVIAGSCMLAAVDTPRVGRGPRPGFCATTPHARGLLPRQYPRLIVERPVQPEGVPAHVRPVQPRREPVEGGLGGPGPARSGRAGPPRSRSQLTLAEHVDQGVRAVGPRSRQRRGRAVVASRPGRRSSRRAGMLAEAMH